MTTKTLRFPVKPAPPTADDRPIDIETIRFFRTVLVPELLAYSTDKLKKSA